MNFIILKKFNEKKCKINELLITLKEFKQI